MLRPLLSIGLMALGLAPAAEASTFRRITFPELMATTSAVVQVKVLDTESYWYGDEHGYITTVAHLEVVRSLDGSFDVGEELYVREAGGELDGYVMQAIGFPQFDVGDELVLFLGTWLDDSGDWRVNEYGQGIYEVFTGADGIERVVPANVQGHRANRSEVTAETVVPTMTPVTDLIQTIRATH
ncbi:MAG: hypothetical protein ABMB14_21960 [Myxococcota bacterium]